MKVELNVTLPKALPEGTELKIMHLKLANRTISEIKCRRTETEYNPKSRVLSMTLKNVYIDGTPGDGRLEELVDAYPEDIMFKFHDKNHASLEMVEVTDIVVEDEDQIYPVLRNYPVETPVKN